MALKVSSTLRLDFRGRFQRFVSVSALSALLCSLLVALGAAPAHANYLARFDKTIAGQAVTVFIRQKSGNWGKVDICGNPLGTVVADSRGGPCMEFDVWLDGQTMKETIKAMEPGSIAGVWVNQGATVAFDSWVNPTFPSPPATYGYTEDVRLNGDIVGFRYGTQSNGSPFIWVSFPSTASTAHNGAITKTFVRGVVSQGEWDNAMRMIGHIRSAKTAEQNAFYARSGEYFGYTQAVINGLVTGYATYQASVRAAGYERQKATLHGILGFVGGSVTAYFYTNGNRSASLAVQENIANAAIIWDAQLGGNFADGDTLLN